MSAVSLQIEALSLSTDQVDEVQVFQGPVELGRQVDSAERLYSTRLMSPGEVQPLIDRQGSGVRAQLGTQRITRFVIAGMNEDSVSRHHAIIQPISDSLAVVMNVSSAVMVRVGNKSEILPGRSAEVELPTRLMLGAPPSPRVIKASVLPPVRGQSFKREDPNFAPGVLRKLDHPTAANLGAGLVTQNLQVALRRAEGDTTQVEEVIRWLHEALAVLQAATNSVDFFRRAAQSLVDVVNCDRGAVVLLRGNEWVVEEFVRSPRSRPKETWRPSASFLGYILQEKRTCWQSLDQANSPESLISLDMVVGAPILAENGEVLGVLYGDCDLDRNPMNRHRLTRLEATLVDVLAGSVANGLARIHQQKAAIAAEVRFDQFFTPELSHELARNPNLLTGQDREITLLFADIRGFSRLSEHLGPAVTMEWIGDIMNELSDCVLRYNGVLVDYLGDELMAMWGAPSDQPDHARRAALAALDMLSVLPALNDRWRGRLDHSIRLGIGINTGTARVGNTGSKFKFKYGPLGPMVNLAARLQGATKYLRVPILISESTASQLGPEFLTRRLCSVRVVNIQKPVSIYELSFPDQIEWEQRKQVYEQSLKLFEEAAELPEEVRRNVTGLRTAAKQLGQLLSDYSDDGPSMVLLSRVVSVLADEHAPFDAVWELPGK